MSDFKDTLLEYQNHTGKLDALFTIMVFSLSKDKLIENLFHQLKKVKNMSGNVYKKKLINNKNSINLIEYNNLNINKIKLDFSDIKYYFIPQLYSKYFEDIYKEKYIAYQDRKYDILFLGGGAETINRRKKILDELKKT